MCMFVVIVINGKFEIQFSEKQNKIITSVKLSSDRGKSVERDSDNTAKNDIFRFDSLYESSCPLLLRHISKI